MAKSLWMQNAVASTHRGDNSANLRGTAIFWTARMLGEVRGVNTGTGNTQSATTVAGPTAGVEVGLSTAPFEWLSDPLSADFTISGTVTFNLWAFESANAANAAINAVVEKIDGAGGALTQIVKTARVTELTTTSAAANFTAAPTSTACKRGDRLRVRVFVGDAGTMGSGNTASFNYDRSTAGVQGESFVTFTENLTFETAAPSGSTYYLTDTAETINPGAAIEKKALTTRGSGSVNSATTTVAGPTAGIQLTNNFGGTAVEWYTPPLNAVTLGGRAQFNIRAWEGSTVSDASLRAEIAITATDGTGATVWGSACVEAITTYGSAGELNITDTATNAWPAGDDTALSAGQRLRFRLYVDDCGNTVLPAARDVTVTYNGTTAAAAGDTYVILPVTVTEQVAGAAKKPRVVSTSVPVMRAAVR